MRLHRLLPWLAALAAAPGCTTFYQDRPVAVVVRDAETKAPIAGAAVRVSDVAAHVGAGRTATTADNGTADLKVAPSAEIAYAVEVSARGYLGEESDLPVETLRAAQPAGLFGSGGTPTTVVLELYASPRAAIELVVPTGYRGVVKAEVQVQEGSAPPGQRVFRCEVPANGVVPVIGPPLLRRSLAADFQGRYADGTPLRRDAKDDEVGLRWLRFEGNTQVFVVGTKSEWKELHQGVEKELTRRSSGGSSDQPPQGRRGGRGGGGGSFNYNGVGGSGNR